jgi:hypothetical protein
MAFKRKRQKNRPPVEGQLRRLPGQSVREELDRILHEKAMDYFVLCFGIFLLAAWEWFRWLTNSKPQPLGVTGLAVVVLGYCAWRILGFRREIRNLRQGEQGERRISEILKTLRDKDYVTFDDLVGENGNIDHVVVGPGGIFAIETKAWTVFGEGRIVLTSDGALKLSGKDVIGDPLKQARASAAIVSAELERHMRRKFWVNPVVVFPGWEVDLPKSETDVVILNDKTVSDFFKSRREILTTSEIREICSHLDRSARS